MGCDNGNKGYRIYTGNNRVVISGTVKFLEHGVNNIKQDENNTQTPSENIKIDLNGDEQYQIVVPQQVPVEPRRSLRQNRGVLPDRFGISVNICQVEKAKS